LTLQTRKRNRKREWEWGFRDGVFGTGEWGLEPSGQRNQNKIHRTLAHVENRVVENETKGEARATSRRNEDIKQVSISLEKKDARLASIRYLFDVRRTRRRSRRVKANGDLSSFLGMAYDGFARLSMLMDFSIFSSLPRQTDIFWKHQSCSGFSRFSGNAINVNGYDGVSRSKPVLNENIYIPLHTACRTC